MLGAADLASVIVDAMDKDGFNYERPQVVQAISDFKDAIDKRMPIYRENPNAFDVTDVAWCHIRARRWPGVGGTPVWDPGPAHRG